jgi:hypothetical protein
MNNEPVAWMQISAIDGTPMKASLVQTWADDIPLYTHPAKALTDEEILQQAEWMFGTHFFECIDDPYWIEFARAILRKAQE